VFIEYKAKNYGNGFSANVIRIGDSLESIGYGYSPPRFHKKDIEKYFEKNSRLKLDYEIFENPAYMLLSNNFIIIADLRIDEFGKIVTVTCWDTKSNGLISISLSSENMYVKEVNRLLTGVGKTDPATFQNKPILDGMSIYFPFTK